MGTRADLLAAAEGLAVAARDAAALPTGDGQRIVAGPAYGTAAEMVAAAKTALEAAALAENVSGGEIDAALDALRDELAEAGLIDAAFGSDTAEEFLRIVLRQLVAWQEQAERNAAFAQAYDRLRVLTVALERDFTAGGTDTSLRIAGRVTAAREEAEQVIRNAYGQDGGS